jgi:MerR family transcriptional regulator, mercuric resistance operon regulatory protein
LTTSERPVNAGSSLLIATPSNWLRKPKPRVAARAPNAGKQAAQLRAAIITPPTPTFSAYRIKRIIFFCAWLTMGWNRDYKTCSNYRIKSSMSKISATYFRGQLAELTGVKSETIRYYEQRGLLCVPMRSPGGHRIYSQEHVRRLQFIRRCRELGFSLVEIEGLLELTRGERKSCEQVQNATEVHFGDVQKKISDLRKMEHTLEGLISQCDDLTSPTCPIIEALSGEPWGS